MFPFLFWISISLGALVFLFLFWPRKRYFPGPPMIGVFGILLEAIPNMSRRHLHHLELRRRFGPVIQINRSTQPAILLTEPEDVKCLVENRDVFPDRPSLNGFKVLTPQGLLGLDVEDPRGRWAAHRRLLSPLFAEKLMRAYAVSIAAQADKVTQMLRSANGRPIDMVPLMSAMALDAIGVCGFATEFGALEGVDDERHFSRKFTTAATEALAVVVRLTLMPWFVNAFDFASGDAKRTRAPFQEILTRLRREFYAMESSSRGVADSKTMLSELLQSEARGELTSDEVDDEMRTMLFAGFDTTAHTMSWTLYELARNPAIQERLRALPSEAERVAYAKLCALEGLRHHCTVVATPRLSSVPFTLRGVEMPANTLVVVSFSALNFGAHWGADVAQFVPERHRAVERPTHEFMPFGFGTRVCIGKRFALLEAETVIAKIVSQFRVKLAPGGEPTDALTVTLAPKGLKLIFEPL